ncbi:hypothetical protein B0H11DRAFT_2243670 [Mycena galericulata]|nr:hypothetical protein B0H11DRAFT_2243670 [Mycena galericulata]
MNARGKRGTGARGGRGGRKPAGTKRSAPVDSDYEDATPKPKRGKNTPLEPRMLPERDNRGVNPTRVDPSVLTATRPRRPNGAGAADQAEKVKKAEDRELRRQAAIAMLAEINAEQDADQVAEEENAIYALDDLPPSDDAMEVDDMELVQDEDGPVLSITQEDFDRVEDDDSYVPALEAAKPVPSKAAPTKRAKKPEKGETRAEIEVMTKKIVAEKNKELPVKKVQSNNAAASSKRAGLSQTWIKSNVGAPVNTSTPESPKIGGLTDDDAGGSRPESKVAMQAPRKNNMVGLIASSEPDDTPSRVAQTQVKPPTRKARPSVLKHEKMPALTLVTHSTPQIKSESSSSSFTPESAEGLPGFIAKSWGTVYLPACYRALYLSRDPMSIGAVGKDLMKPGKETVLFFQAILDEKYAGNSWVMEWGDAICTKAVSRVGERRSAIGKAAMVVVDRLFDSTTYYKLSSTPDSTGSSQRLRKSQKISDDARYAVRSNGPAFYKDPTPEDVCKLGANHPAYVKPRGYLESPLIIETLCSFIKDDEFRVIVTETPDGEEHDFSGLPIGLLGMVAAAVERAYKLHTTGVRTKAPGFSSVNYGTAVAGFIASIQGFRRSRWDSIIKSCGSQITERAAAAPVETEQDSLDGLRERMYIPSSP